MADEKIPPRIHVLAKPTGATCNLNCSYCFFLNKEQLYPGSHFRMSDEVLEQYIRQLIESHRTDKVTVAWQGGEPTLMGLDFYRRAIEYQNQYQRPGMIFENTMQTNGTLLNDEWCEFFRRAWLSHRHQYRRSCANCTMSTGWTRAAGQPLTG